jgi:hypothetical protein
MVARGRKRLFQIVLGEMTPLLCHHVLLYCDVAVTFVDPG